jgi:hypothetical protein
MISGTISPDSSDKRQAVALIFIMHSMHGRAYLGGEEI